MSTVSRFLPAVFGVVLTLAACGGETAPPPGVDGGSADLGGPVDLGGGGSDARIVCVSDVDCNDGLFCNGREMCAPASASADVRGCVPGDAPCSAGETCDEMTNDCRTSCDDLDGDGHTAVVCGGDDCDDADASRYPGATEICDDDDEDCNDTTLGFVDADMDGAGSASCCNGAACGSDCDDTNASIRPGIADGPAMNCNGIDDDCDGTSDVGCPCADGERRACYSGPAGTRTTGICIDGVSICAGGMLGSECIDDVLPASEVCNALDDDCDGMTDEGVLPRFYVDVDGDGFGQTAMFIDDRCNPPTGYVAAAGDCDDTLPTVHPGLPDLCNGIDDDCDTMIDEGAPQGTYYRDDDDDGYGATGTAMMACSAPPGFVPASGDCDDTRAGVSPVGVEVCDVAMGDEDCDSTSNEGCLCIDGTSQPCGGGTPVRGSCRAGLQRCIGGGWAGCSGNIDPGTLTETCNGVDDDCDGMTDEALVAASCFADTDSDAYGAGTALTTLCRDAARPGGCPSGYSNVGGDCNDANATTRPMGSETCNGIDDDCDGSTDETLLAASCFADSDSDGFGGGVALSTLCRDAARPGGCPSGYSNVGGDCNDSNSAIRPMGTELCDAGGVDDDCDGTFNEGCACSNGTVQSCGGGGRAGVGICRSGSQRCLGGLWLPCEGNVEPAAVETCNGIDDNCIGGPDEGVTAASCYVDGDSDGRGTGTVLTTLCRDAARLVTFGGCPVGYSNMAGDCNDGASAIYPGAAELCNGIDDNCAAGPDELLRRACYVDADSDGFGAGVSSSQCIDAARVAQMTCPVGYSYLASDCNDTQNPVHPGAVEACNGIDDNCVGGSDEGAGVLITYYRDVDGDGYGGATTTTACAVPAGYAVVGGDCNDGSSAVRPGAPELCNGIDDNCSTIVDEGVRPTWYRDADGDFWGNASMTTQACSQPAGYVSNASDCNDASAAVYPGAVERCNNIDDNCTAGIDEPPANLDCNGLYPYPGVSFSCTAGACAITGCPTGTRDCNSNPINGCETDITSDEANCGACGTNCSMICASSSCDDPTMISIGADHACARRASGRIVCWGNGNDGQLGNSTYASSSEPSSVFGIADATTVAASRGTLPAHTCALRTGGLAWCWGANTFGQLGSGTTMSRIEPIVTVAAVQNYIAISAGGTHTCAIRAGGQVACWGGNEAKQIGPTAFDSLAPPFNMSALDMPLVTTASQIGAGLRHTCALLASGQVTCWGSNQFSQLGDGPASHAACPDAGGIDCSGNAVIVGAGLADATAIAVGANHACALRASGAVVCWGRGTSGQLGNGGVANSNVPVPVSGLADAVAVSAGASQSCARRASGQVVCWGARTSGALGDGLTAGTSAVPVSVTGLSNATFIASGGLSNCAIRTGTAPPSRDVCWGTNANGQLGDGTTLNRSTFVAISPLR